MVLRRMDLHSCVAEEKRATDHNAAMLVNTVTDEGQICGCASWSRCLSCLTRVVERIEAGGRAQSTRKEVESRRK